jgi:DNA-binding transcriptional MerR regulator
MFNIGEFARLGRVSVRMLRHYDAIGVLAPAAVDPDSSYRLYSIDQLPRLNRLIALKDLGFKLEQVRVMLDESIDAEELAGMLRLRRAELEAQITADSGRLARVEARLRSIQEEGQMITQDVTLKSVPQVRVAELRGTAGSWAPEDIGPEIKSLLGRLGERLAAAGVQPRGEPIAYYEPREDDTITVGGAVPVDAEPGERDGFTVTDLPPLERAATMLHYGSMEGVVPSYEALGQWIEENGLRSVGLSREVTLQCPADEDGWVTELQMEVADA